MASNSYEQLPSSLEEVVSVSLSIFYKLPLSDLYPCVCVLQVFGEALPHDQATTEAIPLHLDEAEYNYFSVTNSRLAHYSALSTWSLRKDRQNTGDTAKVAKVTRRMAACK